MSRIPLCAVGLIGLVAVSTAAQNLREMAREHAVRHPGAIMPVPAPPGDHLLKTFEELSRESEVVVQGTLVFVRSYLLQPSEDRVVTDYRLVSPEVLAGRFHRVESRNRDSAAPVTITVWGGEVRIDGVTVRATDYNKAPIVDGRDYLWFLRPSRMKGRGLYEIHYAGIFEIAGVRLKPLLVNGNDVFPETRLGTAVASLRHQRTLETLQESPMRKVGQEISRFVVAAALLAVLPTFAAADPVRVTVHFTVAGDARLDPDFGRDTSSGSFSILTNLRAGEEGFDLQNGLGADAVSFTWAGTTWNADNADVLVLGFDAAGNVTRWSLNGIVPGDAGGTNFMLWPDFSVACGVCGTGRAGFNYTTARSAQFGIFSGSVTSFSMQVSPDQAPVPEPMSLLLVSTGVVGLAARRRRSVAGSSWSHPRDRSAW